MTEGRTLLDRLAPTPAPGDDASLPALLDRVRAADGAALLALLDRHPAARRLVAAIAHGSPFLSDLIAGGPGYAVECLTEVPEDLLDRLCRSLRAAGLAIEDGEDMSVVLRLRRREAALLVALADLGGVWDGETVMAALTRLADAAVAAAVDHLLLAAHRAGRLALVDPAMPGKDSGYIVLAMGKQGAGELNYSSDIDLIVLFDPKAQRLLRNDEPAVFFVRLTKRLVRPAAGRHRGGLCLPRRPAAQARSARHPGGDRGRGRRNLLREHGPELGTRRHDQGAAVCRRPRPRRGLSRPPQALCLAQVSRLRGHCRRAVDEAPDPCRQGPCAPLPSRVTI